jgi:hypothetical protein
MTMLVGKEMSSSESAEGQVSTQESTSLEKGSTSVPAPSDTGEHDVPEGGLRGYAVILGA